MITIFKLLIESIRASGIYNADVQVAPACILWPDHERQWEEIIPVLQKNMPELLCLGAYDPEKRVGPAIWLRCVIAGKIPEIKLPKDKTPVIYLPGVSRQDLRAIETCPEYLKPIAELQYRGVIWSQINAKDWTILAFLKSEQGGLGLDVPQDNETKEALRASLSHLLNEDVELLKGKYLDKDYFNKLITGGDTVRELLKWLDQTDLFKTGCDKNYWKAFVNQCKSQFSFNPENDSVLTGAKNLALHEGQWQSVWSRFCEAPEHYPNIPKIIRKCNPPEPLFEALNMTKYDGWPQCNEEQENTLRKELLGLKNITPKNAREKIIGLEKDHAQRRKFIWAKLGESPLAQTLEHLAVLAKITTKSIAAGNAKDMEKLYCKDGWKADDGVLKALSCVEKKDDISAIITAIQTIYLPWIEESAIYLQKIVHKEGYPGGTVETAKTPAYNEKECILFIDGLRFDVGKRLVKYLKAQDCKVEEKSVWKPIPSVTPTGKPSVTPVTDKIRGLDANADFEPAVIATNQSLKGGYHLKKLIKDAGWSILEKSDDGDGKGNAWCEFGNIDNDGHEQGWKLAKQIQVKVYEIGDFIIELLKAGWKKIHVVTDHGWLLMPGELPKIDLYSGLTENKWGRCASIKPDASIASSKLYQWYWNPNHYFALADGISCFRKGNEYAHGGLSLQECLTLELIVSDAMPDKISKIQIINIEWKGLRCYVKVDGEFSGLILDIRTQAGNSSSSIVNPKMFNKTIASVVVEDDDMEGKSAFIVLLTENGELIAQESTIIGGSYR